MARSNALRDKYPQFLARDRKAWRAWLAGNHGRSSGVWLVYYKQQSGRERLAYHDAVEEALCFGWIDSLMQPLDGERYMQLFTPRKPKSGWSKSNKQRVARLMDAGLMMPAGLARIEEAKQNGAWSSLDAVENLTVPPDLARALRAKAGALRNFESYTPGLRKQCLFWLNNAKREETRARRIAAIVAAAAANRKPFD